MTHIFLSQTYNLDLPFSPPIGFWHSGSQGAYQPTSLKECPTTQAEIQPPSIILSSAIFSNRKLSKTYFYQLVFLDFFHVDYKCVQPAQQPWAF